MQLRRLTAAASTALALVLIATGGCATSSAVGGGEQLNVQFVVNNNLPGISGVTVYIVSESGGRRSLGPVNSGQRQTYARALRAGDYHLVASRVGAEDITSDRFRLDTDNFMVTWVLQQNQLTFATTGGQ